MLLLPRDVQKIKEMAQELFKAKQFQAYESDLQAVVCTIQALKDFLAKEGLSLPINLKHPTYHDPID